MKAIFTNSSTVLVNGSRQYIHDMQVDFDLRMGVVMHHILGIEIFGSTLESGSCNDVGVVDLVFVLLEPHARQGSMRTAQTHASQV